MQVISFDAKLKGNILPEMFSIVEIEAFLDKRDANNCATGQVVVYRGANDVDVDGTASAVYDKIKQACDEGNILAPFIRLNDPDEQFDMFINVDHVKRLSTEDGKCVIQLTHRRVCVLGLDTEAVNKAIESRREACDLMAAVKEVQ